MSVDSVLSVHGYSVEVMLLSSNSNWMTLDPSSQHEDIEKESEDFVLVTVIKDSE